VVRDEGDRISCGTKSRPEIVDLDHS
jgi:hypothetical protein